jgi:DNA-binding response OmpR family regulator
MPNLDGIAMITQLRADETLPRMPILALTAYGQEFTEAAINAGADAAREKPFNFDELTAQVWEILKSR